LALVLGRFLISGFFGVLEVVALGAYPLAHGGGLDLARTRDAIGLLARAQTHSLAAHWTFSLFHDRARMLTPAACLDKPQWRPYRT